MRSKILAVVFFIGQAIGWPWCLVAMADSEAEGWTRQELAAIGQDMAIATAALIVDKSPAQLRALQNIHPDEIKSVEELPNHQRTNTKIMSALLSNGDLLMAYYNEAAQECLAYREIKDEHNNMAKLEVSKEYYFILEAMQALEQANAYGNPLSFAQGPLLAPYPTVTWK